MALPQMHRPSPTPRPALRVLAGGATPPRSRRVPQVIARLAVAAMVMGGGLLSADRLLRAEQPVSRPEVRVVVEAGDTVWSLAERYGAVERDVRLTVESILARNDVDATGLQPGTTLLIP